MASISSSGTPEKKRLADLISDNLTDFPSPSTPKRAPSSENNSPSPETPNSRKPLLPQSPEKKVTPKRQISSLSLGMSSKLSRYPTFIETFGKYLSSTNPTQPIDDPAIIDKIFTSLCAEYKDFEIHPVLVHLFKFIVLFHQDITVGDNVFAGGDLKTSCLSMRNVINSLLMYNAPQINEAEPILKKFSQILEKLEKEADTLEKIQTQDQIQAWSKDQMEKIWHLKPNESHYLPSGWSDNRFGHAMVEKFHCQTDGSIEMTNYNTGAGTKFHVQMVDSRKIRGIRAARFSNLSRKDLFFSDKISEADPSMLRAHGEFLNAENGKLYTFGSEHIYLMGLSHIREHFTSSDGKARTLQRGGTCSLEVLLAILEDLFNEANKGSTSNKNEKLFKYIKYRIRLATLTTFYTRWDGIIQHIQDPKDLECVEVVMLLSSLKLLRSSSKLLKMGVIDLDLSIRGFVVGKKISERAQKYIDDRNRLRESQFETYQFEEKSNDLFPGDPADYILTKQSKKKFGNFKFPAIEKTPEPENLASALENVLNFLGPFTNKYVGDPQIENDLFAIENFISKLPVPRARDQSDYWNRIPAPHLRKCLNGISSLMDQYSTLFFSLVYPTLSQQSQQDRISALKLARNRNIFIKFIAISHALAIRQDEEWRSSIKLQKKLRPLSTFKIAIPHFGYAENGNKSMDGDRYQLFEDLNDFETQIELRKYFEHWNGNSLSNQDALFDIFRICSISLKEIDQLKTTQDYKYFKELLALHPQLSKFTDHHRRIKNDYNYPASVLLPVELMLDTGISMYVPLNMGDASGHQIESPLNQFNGQHLAILRKAYVLFALTQYGEFKNVGVNFRGTYLSMLVSTSRIYLFGNGISYYPWNDEMAKFPYGELYEDPTVRFIESSVLNRRINGVVVPSNEEAHQIATQPIAKIGTTSNLHSLFRTWFAPTLQPFLVLDNYQMVFDELGSPSVQRELMTLLFKDQTIVLENGGKKYFHYFYLLLKHNSSFIERLSNFLNDAIQYHQKRTISTYNPSAILFILKIAALVKISRLVDRPLIQNESSIIEFLLQRSNNDPLINGTVHLFNFIDLSLTFDPSLIYLEALAHFALYTTYGLERSLESAEIENWAKTKFCELLPEIEKKLKDRKNLESVMTFIARALQIPESNHFKIKVKNGSAIYLDNGVEEFSLNLFTYKIFIPKLVNDNHPGWTQVNLQKILNSKRYPFINDTENLQFEHPIFQRLRFIPDSDSPGRFLLQIHNQKKWYTYIDPATCLTDTTLYTSTLPAGFWLKYSLWAAEFMPSLVIDLKTGDIVWKFGLSGDLIGNQEILCCSIYTKQGPLRSYLEKFEDIRLILIYKNLSGNISEIDFICCRSTTGRSLTFKLVGGQLVWMQNTKYRLAEKRPLGLLGTIDDYLYLEATDGSNPKILVSNKINKRNHTEDYTHKAALTKAEEPQFLNIVHDQEPSVTTFFEYEVKGKELVSNNLESKINLVYLYAVQSDFKKAIAILDRISVLEEISDITESRLTDIVFYNGFEHPNLYAVQMRAILIFLENSKKNPCDTDKDEKYIQIYIKYLNTLNNIPLEFQLKKEAELFILEYMLGLTTSVLFSELSKRRKTNLEEQLIENPYILRPKLSDVLYLSFGNVPNPLPQESIDKIPTIHRNTSSPSSLLEPKSLSDEFYYWYKVATDRSIDGVQKRRLLKYRLGLLSRQELNGAPQTDLQYNLLEYLRVIVLKPEGFPECPQEIFSNLMSLWFQRVHEKYLIASAELLNAFQLESDVLINISINETMAIEDLTIARGNKFVPPLIEDLDEYNLNDLRDLFEIPDNPPIKAPQLFLFDLNELTEEQLPYQNAINAEFEKFQADFEAGYNQIHNSRKFILSGDFSALSKKLNDKLELFKSHFSQLVEAALKYAKSPAHTPVAHLLEILDEASKTKQEITFNRLVGCLLIKDWTLLKNRSPHLTPGQLEDVHKLTLQSVWIGVHIQSLERCIAITKDKSLDVSKAVQNIGEELFVRRSYPPQKYPSILAQEFLKGIKLRTYQGEFLEKSLKTTKIDGKESYIGGVFQVPPGGGKSSELAPQLGFQAATGKRLALYLVLPTQYDALRIQIPKNQMEYFGQETDCISFKREELTPENIVSIRKMLYQAIIRKRLVLMPSDLPSILFVHWIDLMLKESENFISNPQIDDADLSPNQEAIVVLKDIFKIFATLTDALGDEADLFLSILLETNIMASEEPVPLSWLNLILSIYRIIFTDPKIRNVLNEKNNFRLISTELYRQHVLPHIVLKIFELEISRLVPPAYHEACKEYLMESINPDFEKYIESPEPSHLGEADKNRIEFLRWLRSQTKYKHQDNYSIADYIATVKHVLNDVIVNVLKKIPNRHYGWVKNNTAIGPYKAADSPSQNNFGYIFDELSFYFQTAITRPIPKPYFESYLKKQVAMAEKIAAVSGIKAEETLVGKKLAKLLGTNITSLEKTQIERALNYVNSQPLKRLDILSELAKMQVKYQTSVISSNAINQARRFDTLRVFSGTPYNYLSFDSKVAKNYHPEKGSEGRIAEVLLRKSALVDKHIHVIESTDLSAILLGLKKNHPKFSSIHVISDPVGIFSALDHYTNISSIYRFFKEELKNNPRIRAIFSFSRGEGAEEALVPSLFIIEKKEVIILSGTLEKDFKMLGYNLDEIFYYIPENQSTGSNADMPPNCIHLETLGEDGTQRTIFQGACRTRLVYQTQSVEYLALKSAVDNFPKLGTSIHQNIRQGLINQGVEISKQVLSLYTIAPTKEPSLSALDRILNASGYRGIMTPFVKFKDTFTTSTRIEPYSMFGSLTQTDHPCKIIKPTAEQTLAKWSQDLPELKDKLEKLYADAKKSRYLPSQTKKNGILRMGLLTQNQTLVQAQTQVQSQIKTELMTYKSKEKGNSFYSEVIWSSACIDFFLTEPERPAPVRFVTLAQHLVSTQHFYPYNYSEIFDPSILATENFLHTYNNFYPIFHEDQKPGTQILMLQAANSPHFMAIFLSLNESSIFNKQLSDYYQNYGRSDAFLVTPDGQLFIGKNSVETPPLTGEYLRLLIQINFFNGNLIFLEKHRDATLEWLNEKNTALKIHFLKIRVEEKPFLKELLQNGSFKHLL